MIDQKTFQEFLQHFKSLPEDDRTFEFVLKVVNSLKEDAMEAASRGDGQPAEQMMYRCGHLSGVLAILDALTNLKDVGKRQ